jgi:hypothetical protein
LPGGTCPANRPLGEVVSHFGFHLVSLVHLLGMVLVVGKFLVHFRNGETQRFGDSLGGLAILASQPRYVEYGDFCALNAGDVRLDRIDDH